jgi:hypothetical protein
MNCGTVVLHDSSPSGKRGTVGLLRRIRSTLCSILHHILFLFGGLVCLRNILSCFRWRAGIPVGCAVIRFLECYLSLLPFSSHFAGRFRGLLSSWWTLEGLRWRTGHMFSPQNIQQEALKLMVRCLVSNSESTSPAPIVTSLHVYRTTSSVSFSPAILPVGDAPVTVAGKPARSCRCRLLQGSSC